MRRDRVVHVLYTVHRFWPAVGGTELALLDLAQEIRKLGHEITVVTSDEEGSPASEEVKGIHVRRFAMKRYGKFRLPPKEYHEFVLNGGDWDIVHVKGQRVWSSDYLWRHMPKVKQPKVFTAHGFHQWHMHRRDPIELWYYRWHLPRALRAFDQIIALTGNEVEELVSWGVPREKIMILPDGVNLHEFRVPPAGGFRSKFGVARKHMLLYAGGFYDNKRVDFLVRAMASVKSDAELVVVGKDQSGGKFRAECERLASELGAPVKFVGVVDRTDLVKAFFEADLFLLASKFEGYGIVLLETMAAGVPFVSTPAGAALDLMRAGGGRVADTPQGMARVVDELLSDDAQRRRLGETGKRLAHAQTLENAARQHVAMYERLVARGHK
ncbi:MAG: glycosyltransferase family 4 protein [Candidatus Thermoplasmatota archaeon]